MDIDQHLATCIAVICDPVMATNFVAWFDLDAAGVTRELMQKQVANGRWEGPPPIFDKAPARDSAIWQHMAQTRVSKEI